MNAAQLREHIVAPALHLIDAWSLAAENLVMGTAAQESHLQYVKQLGDGPALGLFQMEPATHDDIWDNYLAHRDELRLSVQNAIDLATRLTPHATRLMWDLRYAAIMCRVHYRRVPDSLPDADDIEALARYWKDHYNTAQGAGTVDEYVSNYARWLA